MTLLKYLLTLLAVGFVFVGLIYLVTFVVLGVFQAIIGYSAKKSSEERKQRLIRRSEPALLVVNSYLYSTCVAELTRATIALRSAAPRWLYFAMSFVFLFLVTVLPTEGQRTDSTSRMRYFLLSFLAASYLFPDFIAPFWKSLWAWWLAG
ncbi:MAG: hypothetical protein PHX83_06005 [Acidobacteriia bacterium]|nr:hypothetical protein [Terriglobia bacterium]